MEACFLRKKKQSYTNRIGSDAEMVGQYYRAQISHTQMEKPLISVASTVLYKTKENNHVPGVVTVIEL